jgi:hypothetical protein
MYVWNRRINDSTKYNNQIVADYHTTSNILVFSHR